MERGWLTPEDRAGVEQFLERKLKKHSGDVRASLAEVLSEPVRQTLSNVADPVVHSTVNSVPRPDAGILEQGTVNYQPAGRERYTLNRLHARGGIGQVWVARDGDLGREVALKELLAGGADIPAVAARFVEEAQITGQLQHPNIVPVYELARPADPGKGPFYTMRFVRGRTLAAAIKQYHEKRRANEAEPLELRELLGHFVAVCNAVAYAQSRGVLHRDLKPGNVVLGDFGEVIVLDWGLAKLKGSAEAQSSLLPVSVSQESPRDQTVQGQALGTPSYMPPEQAEGRVDRVDERSDVYGLGAVLYDILVGAPPFEGPDTATVLIQVVADEPAPPRRKVPETPPTLEAICLKALAKKPAERYASVKELARDVERWLGDEPVSVFPEPVLAKAGRWVKRHRLGVTATAALLVAAVPLSLVIAVNREEARQQAERAEQETRRQKEIAEANETTARQREAESRAVLDFVEHKVFAAARPKDQDGGMGYNVQLADAIQAALPFVETGFKDQPLIEARLRMTLGNSFWYLGKWTISAEQFEAVRTIYAAHLGPDHADTLQTVSNLANDYYQLGRSAEAIKLYEETLALRKAKLGADHPDTLQTMSDLANCYDRVGRRDEALKLKGETLAMRKAKLGADHADTIRSMFNLASTYTNLGRNADALKLFEETLALQKGKLAPDHPDVLQTILGVGANYQLLGRHAEAVKILEDSLARTKARLGPDHPYTLRNMNALAVSYNSLGRHAEALKLWEETLALTKATLGPEHPDTANAIYNIACWHSVWIPKATDRVKQADLAMEWLRKAVAAGFKNVDQIKQDSDLDALRERGDFKKLVAGLEAKAAKKN